MSTETLQPTDQETLRNRRFDNMVAYEEWVTNHALSLYPPKHPLASYTRSLFTSAYPQDTQNFTIRTYRGEPNAFCLPNGAVYVADGLVRLAENTEELRFVLGHERRHVKAEHAKKRMGEQAPQRKTVKEILKESLRHLGQARFHEWEADISSFTEAEERGDNPMAGIDLMKKFQATQQGRSITHGSETSRILNMQTVTRITDIATINDPFTPLPEEITDALLPKTTEDSLYSKFLTSFFDRNLSQINTLIERITPQIAIMLLPEIIDTYTKQKQFTHASGKRWAETQQEIITRFTQQIWAFIDRKTSQFGLSDKQKTMLMHVVCSCAGEADTTNPRDPNRVVHNAMPAFVSRGVRKGWTEQTASFQAQFTKKDDVDAFFAILDPAIISALGVKLIADPKQVAIDTTHILLQKRICMDNEGRIDPVYYADYVHQITSRIENLYGVHGTCDPKTVAIAGTLITAVKRGAGERYQQICAEAETRMPDIEKALQSEKTPQAQLVALAKGYITEIEKIKNQKDLNSKLRDKKILSCLETKKPALIAILDTLDYTSEQGVLAFLSAYQESLLQQTPVGIQETDWNEFLYKEITKRFFAQAPAENDHEESLTRLRIVLAISTIYESELLNIFKKIFDQQRTSPDFSIDYYADIYQLLQESPITESGLHDALQHAIHDLYAAALKRGSSKEAFAELVERATKEFPFNHHGSTQQADETTSDKNRILADIFDTYSFDMDDPTDLKTLYYLSTYFEDPNYSVRLQTVVLTRLTQRLSFDDGLSFFQQEAKGRRMLSVNAFDTFVEQKARTHEELRRAKEVAIGLLTHAGESETFGTFVLAEEVLNHFFNERDKQHLLFAGLGNGKDDETIKTYLYTRWKKAHNSGVSYLDNVNLDNILAKIYTLDEQAKYLVIRDLLTGEQGLLMGKDTEKREALISLLFDSYVVPATPEEEQMLEPVRECFLAFARNTPFDALYFAIAPLLQKRFLVPPQTQVPWTSIIEKHERPHGFKYYEEKRTKKELPTKKSVTEIHAEITGKSQDQEIKQDEEKRMHYERIVTELIEPFETPTETQQISVATLLVETAQTLEAPGVRFLQLLGQYVELPEALEREFSVVYDKMSGQSKISADQTLLRDWPEAEHEITSIPKRAGGGSLISAFFAETQTGETRVIKVMNPNAELHTRTSHEILRTAFTDLANRHPYFAPALPLLDDIREWILGDIHFENFLQEDARFKELHHGFTLDERYRIFVPQSYAPETRTIAQDEAIFGTNLTDMAKLQADGHDMKAIMSLLTTNFFTQIADGQMHANITPGNICVTEDNKVVYFDRNFYQHFSEEDKVFLLTLMQEQENPRNVIDTCLDYTNAQIADQQQKQALIHEVENIATIPDIAKRTIALSTSLRKAGVRFPLRITLLLQNMYYLDNMSKKVGFEGIFSAVQG